MRKVLDRLITDGICDGAIAPGHNHYSMPMHLGPSDTRLADEISNFVREVTKA